VLVGRAIIRAVFEWRVFVGGPQPSVGRQQLDRTVHEKSMKMQRFLRYGWRSICALAVHIETCLLMLFISSA